MTEQTKIDYNVFAEELVEAIKNGELDKAAEMPASVPDADKAKALELVLKKLNEQDDEFNETHAALIEQLTIVHKAIQEATTEEASKESSEAATEETVEDSEKAVEPESDETTPVSKTV